MKKNICIHGHFYQPPRENPWLEEVEIQDSAYPHHDWNERITAECYAPNTVSRILMDHTKVVDVVNNYSKISFNFGPTLLSWMERKKPEIYKAILDADKKSIENFSGHGSAIAQAYNHMIMPLANSRDKLTQVSWGIRDFEFRFGRKPEGLWLPETAVDIETLEVLAENGIEFTILAPNQAKSVRKIVDDLVAAVDNEVWKDVSGARIDPKRPYLCDLPSGKQIALFFYDGPISQDIAFGGLLDKGENFALRLNGAFSAKGDDLPELVHIATDGETYGHHHHFGDMALTYCINHIESKKLANVTIYSEYLKNNQAEYEVEIYENSSWSCVHGVERWKSNCGCNSGMNNGWNQEWRGPLRGALDWLRDNLNEIYEEKMKELVKDAWAARNDYIEVILDRSDETLERFISKHAAKELTVDERTTLLKLLEMQRHAMLMYTSCGWFFDEISGIETVQIICYAARAIQLANEVSGILFEDSFKGLLERAKSNIEEFENGSNIYDLFVKPLVLDIIRVGVHYAISSIFKNYEDISKIYDYTVIRQKYNRLEVGKQKLVIGKITLLSGITKESSELSFAVLYLGDQNVVGGARKFLGEKDYEEMMVELTNSFEKGDIPGVIRLIDGHFAEHNYSLWHLFKDEQREVLDTIFADTFKDIRAASKQIYERNYSAMKVLKWLNMPIPKYFMAVMEEVFTNDILKILKSDKLKTEELKKVTDEINKWAVNIDKTAISFKANIKLDKLMKEFEKEPGSTDIVKEIMDLLRLMKDLKINLNLWQAQNIFFFTGRKFLKDYNKIPVGDDIPMTEVIKDVKDLGEYLSISI